MSILKKREVDILKLVSEGYSYKKIANELKVSLPTIKLDIRSAKNKLHAKNCGHLVALYVEIYLIPKSSLLSK